jgi:hypothetical protein
MKSLAKSILCAGMLAIGSFSQAENKIELEGNKINYSMGLSSGKIECKDKPSFSGFVELNADATREIYFVNGNSLGVYFHDSGKTRVFNFKNKIEEVQVMDLEDYRQGLIFRVGDEVHAVYMPNQTFYNIQIGSSVGFGKINRIKAEDKKILLLIYSGVSSSIKRHHIKFDSLISGFKDQVEE